MTDTPAAIDPDMAPADLAVVAGKYLGAWLFMACMIVPTVVYPTVLWAIADPKPDLGPVLSGAPAPS